MVFVEDSMLDLMMKEVQKGSVKGVKALLAAGANVNGSPRGRPLLWASSIGDINMVNFLIESGADVNAPARNTPCHVTDRDPFVNGEHALHLAVGCERINVMRALLKAGADPNAVCRVVDTPLRLACTSPGEGRWAEIAQELLEAGANPVLANPARGNVLHYAIAAGHVELIAMLVSKLPRRLLSVGDGEGRTPLFFAAERGEERMSSLLVSAGVRQPRGEHRTCCPLMSSIVEGHEGVARVLTTKEGMEAVGDVSAVLSKALCCAACLGHHRILRLLLMADGEDRATFWAQHCVDQHGVDQMTVLHFAAAYGKLGCVRVLLAAGADEAATDWFGRPALHVLGEAVDLEDNLDKEVLDRRKEEIAAVRRELERGPAFSARSWAWPVLRVTNAAAKLAAAPAKYKGAAFEPVATDAAKKAPVLGVRVLRKRRRRNVFFAELVGRHAQKV